MEWGSITALGSAAASACAVLGFWLHFSDRISRADAKAKAAGDAAGEAKTALAALSGQFALHRELVAREYIHREAMRDVEDRLAGAQRESEARLAAALDRLGDRVERLIEDRRDRS